MRGLAGYSFKTGKLTDERRKMLDDYLLVFDDTDGADEWKTGERTYLFRPKNTNMSIIGVGLYDAEKSDGVIWGSNEYNILQALAHIMPEQDFYPYRVDNDAIYFIEDGEVYLMFRKGARVITPDGKGKIFSIDGLYDVCVELDHSLSSTSSTPLREISDDVVYEYTVKELGKEA